MAAAMPVNIQIRADSRTGWAAMFSGESQGKAIERTLEETNKRGYRVVFIIPDKWSFGRHIGNFLRLLFTLGFSGRSPSILIVGERIVGEQIVGEQIDLAR